jgi:hypothetical protein
MKHDLARDDFDFNEVPRRQERLERPPISQCGMRAWMKRNERRSCDGTSFLDSSNQTSEPKIDNDRRHPHLGRLCHSDGRDTVAIMVYATEHSANEEAYAMQPQDATS